MFWFWLFVGPALILALLSLRGERKRAEYVAARLAESGAGPWPPATVIVPVKGADEGLLENLASLASLDYPDYELILTARTASDIPPDVLPRRLKIVLAEGSDLHTGEKVQNLSAAVRMARSNSEVFAFADSDGRASRNWLKALVIPLHESQVGASAGYRWYVPERPGFWSLMRSVWNAAIAGRFGPGPSPFAWGGAMAVRRSVFSEARVLEFWKGSVSDDYALTAAIESAGLKIAFAPGAMVACVDHTTGPEFLRWAKRQMVITRVYYPKLWWPALISHIFYCGSMVAAVLAAVRGYRAAEWVLVAQLGLGMLKGINRATLAKAELPDYKVWFDRYGWVHTWWTPLATWIWLYTLLCSGVTNVIEWRGNRYELSPKEAKKV